MDRTVQIEPIQWIGLTLAMINKTFAWRLLHEVGFRAYQYAGLAEDVFDQLQNTDMEAHGLGMPRILEYLGLEAKKGEKLSETILRALKKEADIAYFRRKTGIHRTVTVKELKEIRNVVNEFIRVNRTRFEEPKMPGEPEYFI